MSSVLGVVGLRWLWDIHVMILNKLLLGNLNTVGLR